MGYWSLLMKCPDQRIESTISRYFAEEAPREIVMTIGFMGIQQAILDPKLQGYFMSEINFAIRQLKVDSIIIVAHEDCNVYDGGQAFKSPADEANKLHRDLWRARRVILDGLPNANFDIELLVAIKIPDGWRIYKLREERARTPGSSIGFITSAVKHRIKRRRARESV